MILVSSTILFSACKKDTTTTTCKTIQAKIVSANSTDTTTINYSYNSAGKLIKIDMSGGISTNFTYSGSTLTRTLSANNIISETDVYTLNSSGCADIAINKDANSKVVSNTVYTYDDNGYLTTKTTTMAIDNTDVTTFTYSYDDNGNMTSSYAEHNVGSTAYTSNWQNDFEYFTDKLNKNSSAVGYEGKKNTNLTKSNTYYFNGALALTTNYAYELNADGYISKQTAVIGGSITYTFPVYSCK